MRELVQRQARALGDPTRYEIFRYVAEAPAPVRVAALAEHFGFNHNAIRQHLAKLTEADLLTEEFATPTTTGRPPLQYRVALGAQGSWGSPGPYELLSLLLVEVAQGRAPAEVGAEYGRRLAAEAEAGQDAVDVLHSEMARRGFEPRPQTRGELLEFVLERCPFEAAASAAPGIVCEIHRGLAEGVLDGMDSDKRVRALIALDPARAGCRLQIEPRRPEQTGGQPAA
ncbi:MAG TPA: helix-turn-helix domain-containing protein [Acidimicrobiales bacterium]|nr:helix-turn-helix domain-containing protein [Acidimicrobiales bacterium]